mmetsp:Transcript_17300/g.58465  ORF Transcript_17300/g.58465 Transcript_17300/m.58465 type:complete len:252 (-) Transcript_17300:173-928(-)
MSPFETPNFWSNAPRCSADNRTAADALPKSRASEAQLMMMRTSAMRRAATHRAASPRAFRSVAVHARPPAAKRPKIELGKSGGSGMSDEPKPPRASMAPSARDMLNCGGGFPSFVIDAWAGSYCHGSSTSGGKLRRGARCSADLSCLNIGYWPFSDLERSSAALAVRPSARQNSAPRPLTRQAARAPPVPAMPHVGRTTPVMALARKRPVQPEQAAPDARARARPLSVERYLSSNVFCGDRSSRGRACASE